MTPLSDSEAATVQRFEAAEPAPESWGGGLREALAEAYAKWAEAPFEPADWQRENGRQLAEILLALPELAALRAKADAADRVRALHQMFDVHGEQVCRECSEPDDWDEADGPYLYPTVHLAPWPCATIRALDGPSPC